MSLSKGTIIVHDGTRVTGITPNNVNDVLVYDSSTTTGIKWDRGPQIISAHNTTSEIDISSGWTDITWENQIKVDSVFTHTANSAEITVNESSYYSVKVDIGTRVSSGNSRSESLIRMLKDTGSGYVEIDGTRGSMYNRNSNQGRNSTHINTAVNLNSGDKIKVQCQRSSGSNTILTEAHMCRIYIQKNIS